MRIIIGLFNQPQLLSLTLIQPRLHTVRLLQPLQRQDQQLRVVLVGQGREGDGHEAARLEPVNSCGVDGDSLLGRDVRSVLRE